MTLRPASCTAKFLLTATPPGRFGRGRPSHQLSSQRKPGLQQPGRYHWPNAMSSLCRDGRSHRPSVGSTNAKGEARRIAADAEGICGPLCSIILGSSTVTRRFSGSSLPRPMPILDSGSDSDCCKHCPRSSLRLVKHHASVEKGQNSNTQRPFAASRTPIYGYHCNRRYLPLPPHPGRIPRDIALTSLSPTAGFLITGLLLSCGRLAVAESTPSNEVPANLTEQAPAN